MKNSDELKQERNTLVNAQNDLTKTVKTTKREFTIEEATAFDNRDAQIHDLDKQIQRAEAVEANEKREAKSKAPSIIHTTREEKFSFMRALNALAAGKALTGPEAEVNARAMAEMKEQGISLNDGLRISLPSENRAQTVSEDAGAKGGALVPSTPVFVNPLQPILPIASLGVTIMSGLTGNVPLPTSGSFTFTYTGETDAVTATDVSIAGPTLAPKRCAGVVEISKKLLLQTSFSIENYIINLMNVAYGNAITVGALNGGGTDEPTGLYSLITTNINTTATNITRAIANDLESKVDAANGTNVSRAFFSDTKVRANAKNTLLDAGSGRFLSDGKELVGYNYFASTLVPTLDAGASHPLIFGDWSQLHIGYWGNMSIMVDPYTAAASGKVRLIVEGFSDVACTNEAAFAINKVITVS